MLPDTSKWHPLVFCLACTPQQQLVGPSTPLTQVLDTSCAPVGLVPYVSLFLTLDTILSHFTEKIFMLCQKNKKNYVPTLDSAGDGRGRGTRKNFPVPVGQKKLDPVGTDGDGGTGKN